MKITCKSTSARLTKTELLVVLGKAGTKVRLPAGVAIPKHALESFAGEERETRLTDATGGPAKRVLLIGVGKGDEAEVVRRGAAIAVKKAGKIGVGSAVLWTAAVSAKKSEISGQALAEGAVMGSYRLTGFLSEAPKGLQRLTVHGDAALLRGVRRGEIVGRANCLARRLQDTPANHMRPRDMVVEARRIARDSAAIKLKVHDEKAMNRLKMGSLLSVSRGSSEPAYLIHLVYKPANKARRKICLVGKGLTFDAGGISLKPSAKMDEMKYDMSGGAAVLGVFQALAALQPEVEVHGLVPTSENLPDGMANKPGDVVKACDGTTIEVLNTDAEGRLILADSLAHARKTIKPDVMIDLATLTGAVVVALGHELTGAMGNDETLIDALVASGKTTGEGVWPLPILDFHKRDMRGTVADLRNISSPGTGAGSSTGGAFLSNFVGDIPWVHLDIAGSSWGSTDRDYQGGSLGTGVGVRLLLDYIGSQA